MDTITYLITQDSKLFLWLNGMHTPFFDQVMFLFSEKLIWIPLYLSIMYVIIRRWKKEAFWIIPALALAIVFADQISSGLLKEWIQRPRPSNEKVLEGLVHIVHYKGGGYSFVSSHAANTIALALFTSLLFKHKFYTWLIFIWAAFNCYSRIYLGVHYPLDIIGGVIVGCFSALIPYVLLLFVRQPIAVSLQRETRPAIKRLGIYPALVFLLTVLGILIYSACA